MKLKPPKYRLLVFDAETDGLLNQVTVCHCVCVRDYDTGQKWTFRKNKREDTIHKLFALLDDAEEIWGHNIVAFDIPMLEYLYPDWWPKARIRDTLVLARLKYPDQKEKDYRLWEAGKLDGGLIGKHTLDSWGQRLGMYKGDYAKIKEEQGIDKGLVSGSDEMRFWVWGRWTEELEEYCTNDVEVTSLLVKMLESRETGADAVYVQHRLADLMARQQDNGFMFDRERGQALADELNETKLGLEKRLDEEFPGRYIPTKRMDHQPVGKNVSGGSFPDFAMDPEQERRWFGYPEQRAKAAVKYKDPLRPRWSAGAWYTPIKWQDFNPRSRLQITDRLQEMGWEPEDEDYTEKGNVKANDVILRRLIEQFPVAEPLADLMATNKLMGQLADGKQAWLKVVDDAGFIHSYTNACGAVTTRATHSYPNLAQVPAVRKKKALLKDLLSHPNPTGIVKPNAMWNGGPVLAVDKHGKKLAWQALDPDALDARGEPVTVMVVILGLKGGWGYECRSLFGAPEGWLLVGSDLAGIELRCLAHEMAAYDGGAYGRVLLEGDIHSFNQEMFELETRDLAKTTIYACVPMDTTALTKRGWMRYKDVQVGEPILTYNATTGYKEWKPVLEKVYYPSAPITELRHNHSFSIRSTPNHRWFTRRRSASAKRGHYMVDEVATTTELNTEHNIITNAPINDCTGAVRANIFDLPKYGTDWVPEVCSMSHSERLSFLTGFCLADGHQSKTGSWGWTQNKGPLFEAALTASYLAYQGNLHISEKDGTNHRIATVRMSKKSHVTCQKIERVYHKKQQVWCVRTENESWVIRQGDVITITGNTLYGAGDEKIGKIVSPLSPPHVQSKIGKETKARFARNVPAYTRVTRDIQKQASRKYLVGLDGRRLFVRSKHAALNTLLQGMGATIANWWLIFIEDMLSEAGFEYGWNKDYVFCAWIHDEVQIACREGFEEAIEKICVAAAREAGVYLKFRLPVDASSSNGTNWAETH